MITAVYGNRGGLRRRRQANHLNLPAQSRFIPGSCVLVDGSLLHGFIYDGKSKGQQLLSCLLIFVSDGFPELFDMIAEDGSVSFVDRIPAQASSPLADRRFVLSHFFLLYGMAMIRYLGFHVNKGRSG